MRQSALPTLAVGVTIPFLTAGGNPDWTAPVEAAAVPDRCRPRNRVGAPAKLCPHGLSTTQRDKPGRHCACPKRGKYR